MGCMGWSQLILLSVVLQGEMCAVPEIFAHLTQLLMPLAAGKMCVVLEVSCHYHIKSFFKADPSIFSSVLSCLDCIYCFFWFCSFREGITWLLWPNRFAKLSRPFLEIRPLGCQGSRLLVRGDMSCQSCGECFSLDKLFDWVKVHWVAPPTVRSYWSKILPYIHQTVNMFRLFLIRFQCGQTIFLSLESWSNMPCDFI